MHSWSCSCIRLSILNWGRWVNWRIFKILTAVWLKQGRKATFQKPRMRNLCTINRLLHPLFESNLFYSLGVCVCVCVCVVLDQSAFSLHSVLEMFHSMGDKEALCALQSASCWLWYMPRTNSAQSRDLAPQFKPPMQFAEVRNDKGWVAGPRGKAVKPNGP